MAASNFPVDDVHRSINKWAARVIPTILIGLVGYATWVIVVLIGINHLIIPSTGSTGAGIAIVIIYLVLFLMTAACFFRVLQVIATNPGYISRPEDLASKELDKHEKLNTPGASPEPAEKDYLDRAGVFNGSLDAPVGLERFYMRDVFECEIDGLPRWCSTCKNWKPDRSHHCSEVNRCVYKMDHFCPWAGGIISEHNFKFFVQFVVYASLYCGFMVIVTAYYVSAEGAHGSGVNWAVAIGISAFFFLFNFSMSLTSLKYVSQGTTTVDSLTRASRRGNLAILLPHSATDDYSNRPFQTITYPLRRSESDQPASGTIRTFAIIAIPAGKNPYDLPSVFHNFVAVLGDHWYDWIIPVRYSPSYYRRRHFLNSDVESTQPGGTFYKFGGLLEQLKRDNGISITS